MALINSKGTIASSERDLLLTAVFLMLIVVIPTIILSLIVAWRYRKSNKAAKYRPEFGHSTILEAVWWTIPCIIIVILAILTWVSSHRLDPYRPLNMKGKPLVIQAVSLNWKWLFIYPEQGVATVNYIQIPVHRQIEFMITSDGPMNSLEIPQLAGQIYAMAGMRTRLHFDANAVGSYMGLSTNYSGIGFSGMSFTVKATSEEDFNSWVQSIKSSASPLTVEAFNKLAKPSENNPVAFYSAPANNLFGQLIMKYMMPGKNLLK
ncbi:MAG: ubiquinol oxidase subunit II [Legionellaceae bacterium]|nr:ubiquinol oxidase subunit II [Legionellaceae bacterium]